MSNQANQVSCDHCSLNTICFPRGLTRDEISELSALINVRKTLRRGDSICRQGSQFRGIFAIKSGVAKLIADDRFGNEHILRVLLPGELLGFDGLYDHKYHCSAVALDRLSYCELSANSMNDLFQNHPTLTRELFRHSSEKIKQDRELIVLSTRSAEEKMAFFLIDLSDRMKKRGFSSAEFTLSLTRQEIGDHLGLAMETVSRLLKKFQQQGLIVVNSKVIEITNISGLRSVSACYI